MILLTGDKGFIGKHVARMLKSNDIEFEGCDLEDGLDYGDIKNKGYGALIHCGAFVSVTESISEPKTYYYNNVHKLEGLITNNSFGRVIFLSTGGALYGNIDGAKEQDVAVPTELSPYALSKLMGEEIVRRFHNDHLILRLANVHGPGDEDRKEKNAFTHFEEDDPIIVRGVDTVRDFIYITSVVSAIRKGLDSSIVGTFNIGSGLGTNILGAAKIFAAKRDVKIVIEPIKPGEIKKITLDISKAKKVGLL